MTSRDTRDKWYEPATEFVRMLRDRLKMLETDLRLLKEGWRLHFAVDFAEIFRIAYPLSNYRIIDALPEEGEYETFSRELATLCFIFAKVKDKVISEGESLIMLPPYIDEMQATLSLVKQDLMRVYVFNEMLRRVHESVFSDVRFADTGVQAIVSSYRSGNEPLSAEECNKIATYVMENYKGILSAVVAPSRHGGPLLAKMISDQTLLPVAAYFQKTLSREELAALGLERILNNELINQQLTQWLPSISKIPRRKDAFIPNRNDAAACAILKQVNDNLKGMKAMLLLVSHSYAMQEAVNPVLIDSPVTRSVPGVRDLNYFWFYYAHRHKDVDSMLRGVSEMVAFSDELEYMLDKSESLTLHEDVYAASYLIADCQKFWNLTERYQNVSMGAKTDADLLKFLGIASANAAAEYQANVQRGMKILSLVQRDEIIKVLLEKGDEIVERIKEVQAAAESARSLYDKPKS